jgi:hypothetical protein
MRTVTGSGRACVGDRRCGLMVGSSSVDVMSDPGAIVATFED